VARAASTETRKSAVTDKDKVPYHVVNLEFKNEAAREVACQGYIGEKNPVHVISQFNRFATVLLRADTKERLDIGYSKIESAEGLVWLERIGRVEPPPPPPPGVDIQPSGKSVPERIVRGGFKTAEGKKLTGKGVIVAIIDTGVDFRHPDFVRTTAEGKKESRFLAIWDTHRVFMKGTGQPGPILYPDGTPVGTVFTRKDLTADLETKAFGNFDVDSHGTSCAGIAAGNGSALEQAKVGDPDRVLKNFDYRGVAPEANLIAVRIGNLPKGPLDNAWVLNAACEWIDTLAKSEKMPVVISCSFGAEVGGRDGFQIEERWLNDRFPETSPGRLVFFAAGNEGDLGAHGSARSDAGDVARLTWSLKRDQTANIEIYVDAQDQTRLRKTDVKVELDSRIGKVSNPYVNALSGSVIFSVAVKSGGTISVLSPNGRALVVDAYMDVGSDKDGQQGEFTGVCRRNENQLISPATTTAAFAVGSYDFNHLFLRPNGLYETRDMVIGKLSDYSNAGYVRGKSIVKPEFVVPGQWHSAACPDPVPEHVREWKNLLKTEKYRRFNGTSAATPYAAGVAALLLEKNASLTSKQFRVLIQKNATKDKFTGLKTNPHWGYGKLDFDAVSRLLN
jgi:subtilisin family serine protease